MTREAPFEVALDRLIINRLMTWPRDSACRLAHGVPVFAVLVLATFSLARLGATKVYLRKIVRHHEFCSARSARDVIVADESKAKFPNRRIGDGSLLSWQRWYSLKLVLDFKILDCPLP